MTKLCDKAGVKRFGFHALRHAGAIHYAIMFQWGQYRQFWDMRTQHNIYIHTPGKTAREAMATYEKARQSLT